MYKNVILIQITNKIFTVTLQSAHPIMYTHTHTHTHTQVGTGVVCVCVCSVQYSRCYLLVHTTFTNSSHHLEVTINTPLDTPAEEKDRIQQCGGVGVGHTDTIFLTCS